MQRPTVPGLLAEDVGSVTTRRDAITALPSAIASGLLAAACFGLYWFVRGVDREVRK